jgi:hypothetical protein
MPDDEKIPEQTPTESLGVVMPPTDILAEPAEDYKESDVFAWANNLFEYKEDLTIELFWINKNNVLYRTKTDQSLANQMQPLFIDNALEQVLDGAENGMVVRDMSDGESEQGVLYRVQWKKVEKLREVMHWIRTQESEIELFAEEEPPQNEKVVLHNQSY